MWPSRFADLADAATYTRNPERLANHVYKGRLGNDPDPVVGDGYRYRGGGLIQITGKAEYRELALAFSLSGPAAAVAWVRTPAGAAMSGTWYLATRGCLELADQWRIHDITRAVNGTACLHADERLAASLSALHTMPKDNEQAPVAVS